MIFSSLIKEYTDNTFVLFSNINTTEFLGTLTGKVTGTLTGMVTGMVTGITEMTATTGKVTRIMEIAETTVTVTLTTIMSVAVLQMFLVCVYKKRAEVSELKSQNYELLTTQVKKESENTNNLSRQLRNVSNESTYDKETIKYQCGLLEQSEDENTKLKEDAATNKAKLEKEQNKAGKSIAKLKEEVATLKKNKEEADEAIAKLKEKAKAKTNAKIAKLKEKVASLKKIKEEIVSLRDVASVASLNKIKEEVSTDDEKEDDVVSLVRQKATKECKGLDRGKQRERKWCQMVYGADWWKDGKNTKRRNEAKKAME